MPCSTLQSQANADDTPYPTEFCDDLQRFALGVCQCTTVNGTILTSGPTMAPSSRQTTRSPSFPPGAIPLAPSLSPVVARPTPAPGSPCMLCGSGNTIGSPDKMLTFKDQLDNSKTLSCQVVQNYLDNYNVSASTDWCQSLQGSAIEPCACTLPDGTPVQGGNVPTVSPNDRNCWICGETDGVRNTMGDDKAFFGYMDAENVTRKFGCKELARVAEDTIAIPLWYCEATIAQAAYPCRCSTPDGDLLSDRFPTFSPVNGGKPATPAFKEDDDGDDDGNGNGNEAPSPSSGPNQRNSTSNGGNGNSAAVAWKTIESAIVFGVATMLALCM